MYVTIGSSSTSMYSMTYIWNLTYHRNLTQHVIHSLLLDSLPMIPYSIMEHTIFLNTPQWVCYIMGCMERVGTYSSVGISMIFPLQNNIGRNSFHMSLYDQCLLRTSAGLCFPLRKWNWQISAAMDSRTLWYDNALCRLCSLDVSFIELLTTDSLSPNM